MGEREPIGEEAEAVEPGHHPIGVGGVGPFALRPGLQAMHVDAPAGARGRRGDGGEGLLAHPLRADRAVLDGEAGVLEGGDRVDGGEEFGGRWSAAHPRRDGVAVRRGETLEQRGGIAVDQRVTVGDRHREGDADADVPGGTGDGLRLVDEAVGVLRVVAMVGGADAALGEPREGDGGSHVGIDLRLVGEPGDPGLQNVVAGAEGEGAVAAAVVVGVDQHGEGDQTLAGARRGRVQSGDAAPMKAEGRRPARGFAARGGVEPPHRDPVGCHGRGRGHLPCAALISAWVTTSSTLTSPSFMAPAATWKAMPFSNTAGSIQRRPFVAASPTGMKSL